MSKILWLAAAGLAALATPLRAEAPTSPAPRADPGEIIVTAQRRAQALLDVPISVSALSAETLRNAGATDLRGLNAVTPSLFVSSSSSEAVGGAARIRGIGTVGDNPGLESSVTTVVDGVYRARSGVAFTELGAIDRIEVLRGPQGTLFGRNASAGLIDIQTAKPSFTEGGTAELGYGNYDARRAVLGLTGPIGQSGIAYRFDGVYAKRDGFMKDVLTDRRYNDRNRWLLRGQLLYAPTDALSVRIIADYAKRDENCCAAAYRTAQDVTRNADGSLNFLPSNFLAFEQKLGAVIPQDGVFKRDVAMTRGRSFQSDVRDMGLSGAVDWDLGAAKLTSITAYRDWKSNRGQDGDFGSLDLIYRDALNQRFRTFSQETRLQGKALGGRLDWLVGGYYAHERLDLTDNLRFGDDYGKLAACRIVNGIDPGAVTPSSADCLTPAARAGLAAGLGPFADGILDGLARLRAIDDSGPTLDRFRQTDTTWALFTHDVFAITERLSLTLGARYTHDRKTLDANILSDTNVCPAQTAASAAILAGLPAAVASGQITPAQATQIGTLAATERALACVSNIGGPVDGRYRAAKRDGEWSGTAVLAYKPTDRALVYASYSKGFKAGGFNLDRAGLVPGAADVSQLGFDAEKVDSYEIGAKYRGPNFRFAASGFYELFSDFQLNTFNGISFIVENIEGCKAALTAAKTCDGKDRAGVTAKGFEFEGAYFPIPSLAFDLGYMLADTRYRKTLTGHDGGALPGSLFVLPGSRLSNAPRDTITGGATWTPAIGGGGLTALVHADARRMSRFSAGSDLLFEKNQDAVTTINARIGLRGPGDSWSLEFWGQNIFDSDYYQTVAGAPFQGSGSISQLQAGLIAKATGLFIAFPAEPRTYGLTVRTAF